MEYENESYARIGVMPRNGDAESVIWFDVEPFCILSTASRKVMRYNIINDHSIEFVFI